MNLLEYSISETSKTKIKTTLNTFYAHNYINSLSLKQSAFNVCKAIACFDKEINNSECVIALVCLILAGLCFIYAAIVGFAKTRKLQKYMDSLKEVH